jgi:serine/threonine-protein kinase
MTPERWRRIDELFDNAVRLDPADRDEWLRHQCASDEDLRTEVGRLLAHDAESARDGFLNPPEGLSASTTSWPPLVAMQRTAPVTMPNGPLGNGSGFAPRAGIVGTAGAPATTEALSFAQQRLRELAVIYSSIAGIMIFWRSVVLRNPDPMPTVLYAVAVLVLSAIAARLSARRMLEPAQLRLLELGMIALIAGIFAYTQYASMVQFGLKDDGTRTQIVLKNRVLISAILILCYGIYTPKNWRDAVFVVGPLALLPFAVVALVALRHPAAMRWLERAAQERNVWAWGVFGFDAMLLLVLAFGSASGAHTIARLRRQVAEARQLGQYFLRERIGSGGMGEVYLAEHQLLKRPCALKLIRSSSLADPRALERFQREVRLTATLSHPNTVEIYDYGRTEDGTYYYVMEFLPGLSLAELVERRGPLPCARVVYLLRQVCMALREAHAAGLIHRDIKPSNIFAAHRGGMDDVAKLLDFGLARPAATVREPKVSVEGHILGTPLFMSPEQAMGGRELDERSDIYSLGAVAYYLLTGKPPFDLGSGIEVMIAHARDPVVPPSLVRPEVAPDLEAVVLRCLAKPPSDRFPTAEEMERALAACTCAADWDQARASQWWRSTG